MKTLWSPVIKRQLPRLPVSRYLTPLLDYRVSSCIMLLAIGAFCGWILLNAQSSNEISIEGTELTPAKKSTSTPAIPEQAASANLPLPVILSDQTQWLRANQYVKILDASEAGEWSLSHARTFIKKGEPANVGATNNMGVTFGRPYWGYLEITNHSQQTFWYLQISSPSIDHLDWYIVTGDTIQSHIVGGRAHREGLKKKSHRYETITLQLTHQDTLQVYFTIDSLDGHSLPFNIYSASGYALNGHKHSTLSGVFYGILTCSVLIGFSLFAILRDHYYLFYAGNWIFSGILSFMYLDGFLPFFLPFTHIWWHREFFFFVFTFGVTGYAIFSKYMICKDDPPYLMRLALNASIIIPFIGVLTTFTVPHKYNVLIVGTTLFASSSIIFQTASLVALQGGKNSLLYTLATGPSIIGGLIFGLQYYAFIPAYDWARHAWHIGSAIEAILLTFVISKNIYHERRQKILAQQRAYHIQKDAQEKILQTELRLKQELALKVKERTQDLSLIIKNLEKNNIELSELSIIDSLTQVYNRTFFNDTYRELWEKCLKNHDTCTLIMIDADHFKKVNDHYGHMMGDECLRMIGRTLKAHTKSRRMVACRFGGEEFVVLGNLETPEEATDIAEAIRISIEKTPIVHQDKVIHITVSVGVAYTQPHHQQYTMDTLLDTCDQALYKAKQRGRNQVVNHREHLYPDRKRFRV